MKTKELQTPIKALKDSVRYKFDSTNGVKIINEMLASEAEKILNNNEFEFVEDDFDIKLDKECVYSQFSFSTSDFKKKPQAKKANKDDEDNNK